MKVSIEFSVNEYNLLSSTAKLDKRSRASLIRKAVSDYCSRIAPSAQNEPKLDEISEREC